MNHILKSCKFSALSVLPAIFLAQGYSISSHAHAGHEAKMAYFDEKIKANPKDAEALFRRAEENREHAKYEEAFRDYADAEKADPSISVVHLGRGLCYRDQKKFSLAKSELDLFIGANPDHGLAYVYRAQIQKELGNLAGVRADYRKALQYLKQPEPELYLDFADAFEPGKSNEGKKSALKIINEGIQKLGSGISFELPAIELEIELKNYSGALKRIDQVISQASRKERWYLKKADILILAGKRKPAKENLKLALLAIEALPSGFLSNPEIKKIQSEIETKLSKLGGK